MRRNPEAAARGPTATAQVEFTLLFIEFRGAAEFSFCAKRGKENPSLKEGKSKLCPSVNRAFSKGCAGPEAIFSFSASSGENKIIWIKTIYRMCNCCSTAVSVLVTIGLAVETTMAE